MKYTLDATNKKPGRLATEIAVLLMGKNRTDYVRNAIPGDAVEVTCNGWQRPLGMRIWLSWLRRSGRTHRRTSFQHGLS